MGKVFKIFGDIATGWLTYAANASLLKIAQDTVSSGEKTVQLTQLRLNGGIAPKTDLLQAQQILETAQADDEHPGACQQRLT